MTHRQFVRVLTTYVVVAATLLLLLATEASAHVPPSPAKSSVTPQCYEDDPCWRWSTMGNMRRGVYDRKRRAIRIVSPCRFAAMDFHNRIDWTRTPRLRGDTFARRHGCDPYLYA